MDTEKCLQVFTLEFNGKFGDPKQSACVALFAFGLSKSSPGIFDVNSACNLVLERQEDTCAWASAFLIYGNIWKLLTLKPGTGKSISCSKDTNNVEDAKNPYNRDNDTKKASRYLR